VVDVVAVLLVDIKAVVVVLVEVKSIVELEALVGTGVNVESIVALEALGRIVINVDVKFESLVEIATMVELKVEVVTLDAGVLVVI
jgi:hypothetical protein